MKHVPGSKSKTKKDEINLLEKATLRLLKAVKTKAAKEGKPLRKADLLKQGYSKHFIAKMQSS